MKYLFADLIEFSVIEELMEYFHQVTGVALALIDIQGEVLLKAGWQEICTDFHRVHPRTLKRCLDSDVAIAARLGSGLEQVCHKCLNGLMDMAAPVIVNGEHVASVFIGQFFSEEPDEDFFRAQARKYGFDEEAYLKALSKVPVLEEKKVKSIISFLARFAEVLTMMGRNRQQLLEAQKKQQESEAQLRQIAESMLDMVLQTDIRGKILYVSPSQKGVLGYDPGQLLGGSLFDYVPSKERSRIEKRFLKKLKAGENDLQIFRCRHANGRHVWLEAVSSPFRNPEGAISGSIISCRDVTDRLTAEEKLKESEERYREILASIEEGYYEVDLKGNLTFFNEATCRMVGYSSEELLGMNYRQIFDEPEKVYHTFHQVYLTGKPEGRFTMMGRRKNGTSFYVELSISLLKDKEGRSIGFRGVARDITERISFEKQLRFLSFHDQLTALYNRNFFEEEMRRLEGSREYPITIISADLDGLKIINDTMGHSRGDQLLQACADLLKRNLRKEDVLARVGGDEFAIILPRTSEEAGDAIIRRMQAAIENYNRVHTDLPLSVSFGVATTTGRETLEETFIRADDLMYRDKLYRGASVRGQIVNSLLTALAERDFINQGHTVRLQELCQKMGEKLGLSSRKMSDLLLLAQVHDLGKVGIPDRILYKKGELTEEEWEIMRQHPEKGYRIALGSQDLAPIADLILRHHENWDGTGYPLGIAGNDIPIECRILAVVDAFDAMTSERHYRPAMSVEKAVEELKKVSGTKYDPDILKVFLEIIESGDYSRRNDEFVSMADVWNKPRRPDSASRYQH